MQEGPSTRAPHHMRAADVLQHLRVKPEHGLSKKAVELQRKRYGKNEFPDTSRKNVFKLLFARLSDPLILILGTAAAVSLYLGSIEDAVIILIAIAIDWALSFIQVWRTERSLEHMRKRVQDSIVVIREGRRALIPSSELVVGDIMELRAGENVPADGRIILSRGLQTQESALTGESNDIDKSVKPLETRTALSSRTNMAYMGTTVTNGSGLAVITAVGIETEFGKIAHMLARQPSPESPLRKKLHAFGISAGKWIIGAVLLLTGIQVISGNELSEIFRTSITLIVSAIPEDLTMILTIAMTVGVMRIMRHGGVVRRLSSGEALGATTVICTDKTGTLTYAKMTAKAFVFPQGSRLTPGNNPKHPLDTIVITGFLLANDAHRGGEANEQLFGSATERAALAFGESFAQSQKTLRRQWKQRDAITFNPAWKYRAALCDDPTKPSQWLFVTGAPDILLEHSSYTVGEHKAIEPLDADQRYKIMQNLEALAADGKRLLAVAIRKNLHLQEITHDDIEELTFLGCLIIEDPIRNNIQAVMQKAQEAGIQIKMITGDHTKTAQAVARAIGLSSGEHAVIPGQTLQQMSSKEVMAALPHTTIFSRVEPLDKQRIVRLLQKQGHVVAMTGDGVNDTIALKSADIGVAMGDGTDIAKDAADLILLNNGFETIVAAIEEGRVVRDNIRKVIVFLLSTNAAEVAIFFVSIALGLPLPLLPAQILWINLVTDGTSDIALSLEPAEHDVMKRAPENPRAPLFGPRLTWHIIFSGILMTIATMSLYWYLYAYMKTDLSYARTMAFTFLSMSSLASTWSFRSLSIPMLSFKMKRNNWMFVSAGFSLLLHMGALYIPSMRTYFHTVPLSLADWMLIAALAICTILLLDLRKVGMKASS